MEHKDIVRLLKEKEDEELNLIAEVRNVNCETSSCFRFIFRSLFLPFQSLGEQTDRKKAKKKKKGKGRGNKKEEEEDNIDSGKNEFAEEATEAEEETQAEEDDKKRAEETCLEILRAQEIEGQKRQIEESLAQKWKEAFQLAEATGVSVPYDFEEDFSQKDPLVRHLEEEIKEKRANLECPVCLEVIDSNFVF